MTTPVAPSTLAEIRDDGAGRSYPCELLVGCETALVLFAAGFLGRQDGYWIADAGLRATCIDIRPHLLDQMAAVYPTDWQFIEADVYPWVEKTEGRWDIVSVDCPSSHFDRCADMVEQWCALARVGVVLGTGAATVLVAPPGWAVSDRRFRSSFAGGTYWAVLERA